MESDRTSSTPLVSSPTRRALRDSLPGIGKTESPKGPPPTTKSGIISPEAMKVPQGSLTGKRGPSKSSPGEQFSGAAADINRDLPTGNTLDTLAAQTFKRFDRQNQGILEKDVAMLALGEIAAIFSMSASDALELNPERASVGMKRFTTADFVDTCSRLGTQHIQRLRDERIKNTGVIKTQIPPGADVNPDLQLVFDSYCSFTAGIAKPNDPNDVGTGILNQQLNKLCLDIGLLSTEGGPLNVSEMDVAFARVKAPNNRRVSYQQWLLLLCILTDKSGWDIFKVMEDHAQKLGKKAGVPLPSFASDADWKRSSTYLPPIDEGNLKPMPPDYRPPLGLANGWQHRSISSDSSTTDPLWITQVLDRISRLEGARGGVPAQGSDLGRLLGGLKGGVESANQALGQWPMDGPTLSQEIKEMRLQMAEVKNELKEVKKSNEDLKKANVTKAKECDKLLVKMKELEAIVVGKGQAPGPVNTAALESRLLSLEQLTQKQAARLIELQATNQPSAAAEATAPLSKPDTILEPRLAALELQVVSLEKRAKEESKDQKSAGSSVDEDMARHREHIQAHLSRLEEMAQLLSMTQDSVLEHASLIRELESKVAASEKATADRRLSMSAATSKGQAASHIGDMHAETMIEIVIEVEEMQRQMNTLEDKMSYRISSLESLPERHRDLQHKMGQIEKQCIQLEQMQGAASKMQMILQQQYHAVLRPMTGVEAEPFDAKLRRAGDQISHLSSRVSAVEESLRLQCFLNQCAVETSPSAWP